MVKKLPIAVKVTKNNFEGSIWEEATAEGDVCCPYCDELLIIMGINYTGFCVSCKKYFTIKGSLEGK